MSLTQAILAPIISTLIWILKIYEIVLIISIFLSWVNPDPYNPIVRIIYSLTEPILSWIRYRIPLRIGVIDFSPVLVFVAIEILKNILRFISFKLSIPILF